MKGTLSALLVAAIAVQSLGCGTIMHPERRGQRGGRIDPGVAILDGIGLLFFIIPGVIAFAVDFSNGTIYLPSRGLGYNDLHSIPLGRKGLSRPALEAALRAETGKAVSLERSDVRVAELESLEQLPARFAAAEAGR